MPTTTSVSNVST